jgi:wyosine [tRNA(Phe)-imidazoG37] synthetase (radical SAM superfamily)
MVEGIVQFAREFKGALWLELLLVRGIISTPEEIEQLGSLVDRIAPERIQLNTVVRPPADSGVQAVDTTILAAMASRLGAAAEIIANPPPSAEDGHRAASSEEVLELIRRHPCSLEDICRGLLISHVMAQTLVDALLGQQRIASSVVGGTQFYIDPHQLPGSVG